MNEGIDSVSLNPDSQLKTTLAIVELEKARATRPSIDQPSEALVATTT